LDSGALSKIDSGPTPKFVLDFNEVLLSFVLGDKLVSGALASIRFEQPTIPKFKVTERSTSIGTFNGDDAIHILLGFIEVPG
jgi:hypothetical protein